MALFRYEVAPIAEFVRYEVGWLVMAGAARSTSYGRRVRPRQTIDLGFGNRWRRLGSCGVGACRWH
jgi:hypothetical protein